jgi:hypothetical protein
MHLLLRLLRHLHHRLRSLTLRLLLRVLLQLSQSSLLPHSQILFRRLRSLLRYNRLLLLSLLSKGRTIRCRF